MMMKSRPAAAAVILLALAGTCVPADAQTFPARAIRIVVPVPPGGTSDILARSIGQKLSEAQGGVPGYEAVGWNGLVGPGAMPTPIVDKIHDAVVKIVRLPDIHERLVGLGAEPAPSTPAEFAALIKAEIVKWAKVVKDSGAKLD